MGQGRQLGNVEKHHRVAQELSLMSAPSYVPRALA